MEIGLGMLGWTPDVFWHATPHEMFAALDGRNEMNAPPEGVQPPDDDTIADLMARFPDENPDPDLV